jgi:RHS repeat-associated protein
MEDRYEYDAFGKPYKGDLNSGMNLGYTGKPYDTTTGMYNYGYRDYQPEIARFTTVDPIRDGANWFAYVNNDPVNWIDPLGLQCLSASDKNATAKPATASGIGLIAAGVLLGIATIAEDLVPIGGGVLNNYATLSAAGALITAGLAQIGVGAVVKANEAKPSALESRGASPKREEEMKPDDAPTGTLPIDKKLNREQTHEVKRKAGIGSDDWTGISPDGDVIINDGYGNAENLGHYETYTNKRYGD